MDEARFDVMLHDGAVVVRARGEFAVPYVERYTAAVRPCLSSGPHRVIVDLAAVTFIDSSGLGALLQTERVLREQGRSLLLRAVPERVLRVIEIAGLAGAWAIETVAEAPADDR